MARSDGEILKGQEYDPQTDLILGFTQQVQNFERGEEAAGVGEARTEVTPIDASASQVRTFDALTQGDVDELALTLFDNVSFSLPDTLVSVTGYYTTAAADADATETGNGHSTGTTGSLSLSLSSSSQGSAAIAGEVYYKILPTSNWAVDVPATVYLFYMADTSTRAQIMTKLAALVGGAVNAWPVFKPEPVTLFVLSQQVDLSARATASQSASVSSGGTQRMQSEGTSVSKSLGVQLKTITLPPTIHGAITIANSATVQQAVEVTASAAITRSGAGWLDATMWPARTVTTSPSPVEAIAAASVLSSSFNDSIAATAGLTSIPTSGKYARLQVQPWKYGYFQIRAEVIDFSYFA
jgi:hypothetical protein